MRRPAPCPEAAAWPEIQWRHCSRCGEDWPATDDFFWRSSKAKGSRLQCWCKACRSENAQRLREERKT